MSDDLKACLTAWLDWANDGALSDEVVSPRNPAKFARCYGLCQNSKHYERYVLGREWEDIGMLREELTDQFKQTGLAEDYPFGSLGQYEDDAYHHRQHRNEARLAWVREQLEAWTCAI